MFVCDIVFLVRTSICLAKILLSWHSSSIFCKINWNIFVYCIFTLFNVSSLLAEIRCVYWLTVEYFVSSCCCCWKLFLASENEYTARQKRYLLYITLSTGNNVAVNTGANRCAFVCDERLQSCWFVYVVLIVIISMFVFSVCNVYQP